MQVSLLLSAIVALVPLCKLPSKKPPTSVPALRGRRWCITLLWGTRWCMWYCGGFCERPHPLITEVPPHTQLPPVHSAGSLSKSPTQGTKAGNTEGTLWHLSSPGSILPHTHPTSRRLNIVAVGARSPFAKRLSCISTGATWEHQIMCLRRLSKQARTSASWALLRIAGGLGRRIGRKMTVALKPICPNSR